MTDEHEPPLRKKIWMQWVDLALMGGGALLALVVVILASGMSKWLLIIPILGAIWLGWLAMQLRSAGQNAIKDEEHHDF